MIIPFQTSFEDKGTCFPKHFCDLGFRLHAFVNFELCSGHCYIKCISTLGSSFSSFNNASPKLSIQIHKLWSSDSLSTRTYTRKSRYFFIHPQGSLEPLRTQCYRKPQMNLVTNPILSNAFNDILLLKLARIGICSLHQGTIWKY